MATADAMAVVITAARSSAAITFEVSFGSNSRAISRNVVAHARHVPHSAPSTRLTLNKPRGFPEAAVREY